MILTLASMAVLLLANLSPITSMACCLGPINAIPRLAYAACDYYIV